MRSSKSCCSGSRKTDRLYRKLKDWVTAGDLEVEIRFPASRAHARHRTLARTILQLPHDFPAPIVAFATICNLPER
jgi:hypothetical protein